jgi:hypothetical protein
LILAYHGHITKGEIFLVRLGHSQLMAAEDDAIIARSGFEFVIISKTNR